MATQETPQSFVEWIEASPDIHPAFKHGLAGLYVQYLYGLTADALRQMLEEAGQAHLLLARTSPDDALQSLADERLLPRYAGETADAHRDRLFDAWRTWSEAGSPGAIVRQLNLAGFSQAIVREFILAGGHPARDIPNYPSTDEYWSQFNVFIYLDASRGTGAVASPSASDQTASLLISQEQLDTIRLIVRKFKDSDWICREIVILGPHTGHRYGDPVLQWGSAPYGSAVTYGSGTGFASERYPAFIG